MEATAYFKNLHISAKKLRFILPEIKKMTPSESLTRLFYSPKKGARVFYKAIKSAIDNAKYALKVEADLLEFKLFTVEQGNALKRFRPGGRGTAKPYKKKYSHIKIVLTVKKAKKNVQPVKVEKAKLKVDPKKEVKSLPSAKKVSVKK